MDINSQFFFENGPMPNPTIVGSGDEDSAQWSHPCRFFHWRTLFSNNDYPPFKGTTQNQNLFPRKDFDFLPTQAQKDIYHNLVFMATLLIMIYTK